MTRIFIEDYELDIDNTLSNQITYAIDDLNNLDSKATAFSKTIVLPGTTNNNDLLGNIFEFNNSNFTNDAAANVKYNFNASKSAKCKIEVNGLQIIKGVFRLLEIIYDDNNIEYECAVFGELGGFFSSLGNKKTEDLDFSAYNHDYTLANIIASWDNAGNGSGYYYPLIDYGNVSVNKKDYQYKAFRPSLFVREYIDKIITGTGYTWESSFFNTDFFKRIVIPNNSKGLYKLSSRLLTVSQNLGINIIDWNSGIYGDLIPFNSFDANGFIDDTSLPPYVNQRYKYTGLGATVNINAMSMGQYISELPVTFDILINGSPVATTSLPATPTPIDYVDYNVSLSYTGVLVTNDIVSFRVIAYGAFTGTEVVYVVNSYSELIVDNSIPIIDTVALGDPFDLNFTTPKGILQKDFFASILKMFYLMVTEDKFKERHLIIEPWVNFFDTTPSSYIDWTDKVDRGKQIRIKPMSELNARYYQLKFKQDNDFYNENYRKKYNEGYGDRVYDNGFEFSKDTETVEVIFAASTLYGTASEDKVVPAIYKKSNAEAAEDTIEHVIRIMQANKITVVDSWDILDNDGVTVLDSNTDYGYAGHLDDPDAPDADLNFGAPKELFFALATGNLSNNLFNAYYSAYMAEITDKDSRLLQAMVKLSEVDIYNLDFSKFVFVDGGLYRLSKLIDYTAGANEPTKAELLRTIYTTY